MARSSVTDLSDCTEFRLALEARPPRIVHGTALLVLSLLGSAIGWAAVTKADLVVRAAGRIRPVTTPHKVTATFRGEL